jgi:hypothetical protein
MGDLGAFEVQEVPLTALREAPWNANRLPGHVLANVAVAASR